MKKIDVAIPYHPDECGHGIDRWVGTWGIQFSPTSSSYIDIYLVAGISRSPFKQATVCGRYGPEPSQYYSWTLEQFVEVFLKGRISNG